MSIKKSKYPFFCILPLLILLSGCKIRTPKEVIPEAKMESLLYDYHIAKAMGDNLPYSENYKKVLYMEHVYKKYGTTQETFDSSLVWYTRHTDALAGIYERVSKRFRDNQKAIELLIARQDNKPTVSKTGDSIDLWWWNHLYSLTGHPLNNKISFTFPSDSNFHERDTLVWALDYRYLGNQPDSLYAAIMSMQILYSKDSIVSETQRIMASGKQHITLQADTLGAIKSIKGFVYYTGGRDSLDRLILKDISLMRYHSTDTLAAAKTDSIEAGKKEAEPAKKEEAPKTAPVEPEKPEQARPVHRPRPSSAGEAKPAEVQNKEDE